MIAFQSPPAVVATVPDSGALLEDLAWDAARSRFIVSDVRRHRLRTVDLSGHWGWFGRPLAAGWAPLGVAVDSARGVLWVAAATLAQAEGYTPADSSRAAIMRFDLASGALRKRYDLPGRTKAAPGDLAVAPNHDLYSGDGMVGAIYVIRAGADSLETLVRAGPLRSTQQPALLPDGNTMLIPSYGRGIVRVDALSGDTSWLGLPDGRAIRGVDGLLLVGHDLVGVMNGGEPNRIIRLGLDSSFQHITSATVWVRDSALVDEPTHVAMVAGQFYTIGNAGWSKYDDDGHPKTGVAPRPPRLVRLGALPAAPIVVREALQDTLEDLEHLAWVAWKARDGAFYQRFLSDDHVEMGSTGQSGKAVVAQFVGSPACVVDSYTLGTMTMTRFTADVAVLTYQADQVTTCGGRPVPHPAWITSLYLRRDGRWQNALFEETPANR